MRAASEELDLDYFRLRTRVLAMVKEGRIHKVGKKGRVLVYTVADPADFGTAEPTRAKREPVGPRVVRWG